MMFECKLSFTRYFVLILYMCAVTIILLTYVSRDDTSKWIHNNLGLTMVKIVGLTKGHNATMNDTATTASRMKPLYPRILLYNRVPKCASTFVRIHLRGLARVNDFRHFSSTTYGGLWLNVTMREKMVEKWRQTALYTRFSFERHFLFFKVTGFKEGEVAWMNIIRDPVERFISSYYYKKYLQRQDSPNGTTAYLQSKQDLDMDKCVTSSNRDCNPRKGDNQILQLSYFCGQDPQCTIIGNRWALQKAKENVEAFYSVVGIKEDIPTTFEVLQYFLPTFFSNYKLVHRVSGIIAVNGRPAEFAPPVSNTTRAILGNTLQEDLEFYEFIRRRLYVQAEIAKSFKEMPPS